MRVAYLSLGSNMGDRAALLSSAVKTLCENDPYRLSSVFETGPVGDVAQAAFWNLVMELSTRASVRDLLERCRRAESDAQRVREVRWGPRTLDVDVLLVGDERSEDPEILVPHPRMWQRRFVLAPLRELAPELVTAEMFEAAQGSVLRIGTLDTLR